MTGLNELESMLDASIRQVMEEIFATMVFMEISGQETSFGRRGVLTGDLSSMVGLAGDLKGVLTVSCPAAVATAVSSAMLGMELTELDEDVRDAMGEITNMVAGGLKSSLAAEGTMVNIAVPTTIIGRGMRTSGLPGAQRLTVPFTIGAGTFGVELQYVAR